MNQEITTDNRDFSKGFLIGTSAHAMALTLIALLSLATDKAWLIMKWIGLFQVVYIVPSYFLFRYVGFGPRVTKGFWTPSVILLILNICIWGAIALL